MKLTVAQIADMVAGQCLGEASLEITALETMDQAGPGDLTFIGSPTYARQWPQCAASAALVSRAALGDLQPGPGRALIVVDSADLAMARALAHMAPPPVELPVGIHPSAVVDPQAQINPTAAIGPGCVIGARARIAAGCRLHANVTVMQDAAIGDACELWPGVVIRERCRLGAHCILHPNVSIGADGFGYRPVQGPQGMTLMKIPQIGHVEIGDDVEIGANSTIDRGKFGPTTIGAQTKIDNLVQIGHNCRIGSCVIIAGCCAIAGSVTMEDGVVVGGMCAFKDHLHVGAGATLAGGSMVIHDVPAGETWAGQPAQEKRRAIRELMALKHLPDLVKRMRRS